MNYEPLLDELFGELRGGGWTLSSSPCGQRKVWRRGEFRDNGRDGGGQELGAPDPGAVRRAAIRLDVSPQPKLALLRGCSIPAPS